MDLKRLRYFLAVAATGSLGKASQTIGIAQPALGRQIQLLEAEVGTRLFDRMPKGMALTADGEYLRQSVEHHIEMIDIALGNLRSTFRIWSTLTMGLPADIAQLIGPSIVTRLQAEVPGVVFKLIEADSAQLAADLVNGPIDLAILTGVLPQTQIHQTKVLRERLFLVVHPDSEQAGCDQIALQELENLPLILPDVRSGLRINLAKRTAGTGISLNPVLETNSVALSKQLVRKRAGCTILPLRAFRKESERGELRGISIIRPELDEPVLWAVDPKTRFPGQVYGDVERIIFEEWHNAVTDGRWPAAWKYDLNRLSARRTDRRR